MRPVSTEAAGLAAQPDVLGDRALEEEVELLEDGGHAGALRLDRVAEGDLLAPDHDRAPVGGVDAGEHLHQRRLAGTVLADEAVDLARAERQVEPVEHGVAEEALGHPGRDEGVVCRDARGAARRFVRGVDRGHGDTVARVTGFCRAPTKSVTSSVQSHACA
jgi:hypothetical protein